MPPMSRARLVASVLLPFAAGYYLSYLFRSINALIAGDLTAELGLGAADLGLLTSVYFLVFAAVVLPCGVLLDRYGPRLVDSTLLVVAAAGSLLFAVADSVASLLVGRAFIGLGVAVGLMAGLKAIVLWFPPERVALANGCYIMLGALGALSATGPAETVVQALGWRGLFAALAVASAAAALLILLVVPERKSPTQAAAASPTIGFLAIYLDPRFLRIAGWFSLWEQQRRPDIVNILAETRGTLQIELGDKRVFTLAARADRIERKTDGTFAILDYKTGKPPTPKQVSLGLSPQMTLEGAILQAGGFDNIPEGASISEMVYVRLSGNEPPGEASVLNLSRGARRNAPLTDRRT